MRHQNLNCRYNRCIPFNGKFKSWVNQSEILINGTILKNFPGIGCQQSDDWFDCLVEEYLMEEHTGSTIYEPNSNSSSGIHWSQNRNRISGVNGYRVKATASLLSNLSVLKNEVCIICPTQYNNVYGLHSTYIRCMKWTSSANIANLSVKVRASTPFKNLCNTSGRFTQAIYYYTMCVGWAIYDGNSWGENHWSDWIGVYNGDKNESTNPDEFIHTFNFTITGLNKNNSQNTLSVALDATFGPSMLCDHHF